MNEENQNFNNEEAEKQAVNNFAPFIDLLKEFVKETNLEKITNDFNSVKKEKIQADLTANQTNLTFWKWKFTKEFSIIAIILICIIWLSVNDKLESSTIGTLLGSIIGYAIGNFNSKEKQN